MFDPAELASEKQPLRCSSLPLLVRCNWRAVMLQVGLLTDDSGQAADTGSAVHRGVEVWHRTGEVEQAFVAMRDSLKDFPLADLDEARLHFEPYVEDPRNQVTLVANELPVTFALAPHASDLTGQPIYVKGTLDQLRRGPDGRVYLWDLKTGRKEGWDMIHEYALQLAAYCVGAAEVLGEVVHPGGVIRSRGWRKRGVVPADAPAGVFFHCPFGVDDLQLLLDDVRLTIAQVRGGEVQPRSGDWCSYCPAGGLSGCLAILKRYL